MIFSLQNHCFCGLMFVHLPQCGICLACLSLEQSWHLEGRAGSSCPRCPAPPYSPGYKGWTLHKDLEVRDILSHFEFISQCWFISACFHKRMQLLQMPQSSQQSHTFELQSDTPDDTEYCVTVTWGCELIAFDWNAITVSRSKGKLKRKNRSYCTKSYYIILLALFVAMFPQNKYPAPCTVLCRQSLFISTRANLISLIVPEREALNQQNQFSAINWNEKRKTLPCSRTHLFSLPEIRVWLLKRWSYGIDDHGLNPQMGGQRHGHNFYTQSDITLTPEPSICADMTWQTMTILTGAATL